MIKESDFSMREVPKNSCQRTAKRDNGRVVALVNVIVSAKPFLLSADCGDLERKAFINNMWVAVAVPNK